MASPVVPRPVTEIVWALTVKNFAPILKPFVAVSDSRGAVKQVVDERTGGILFRAWDACDVPYCDLHKGNYRVDRLCARHYLAVNDDK